MKGIERDGSQDVCIPIEFFLSLEGLFEVFPHTPSWDHFVNSGLCSQTAYQLFSLLSLLLQFIPHLRDLHQTLKVYWIYSTHCQNPLRALYPGFIRPEHTGLFLSTQYQHRSFFFLFINLPHKGLSWVCRSFFLLNNVCIHWPFCLEGFFHSKLSFFFYFLNVLM